MIRGGTGQNARIREEAKRKIDQDREWLLVQTDELLAREAARDLERDQPAPPPADFWPDETDTFRDLAEERDWEQSARDYERFA